MSSKLSQCTVKLPELGGQGVLVRGQYILTASHCLKWDNKMGTGVVLGDHAPIDVVCPTGHKFQLGAYFVDVVSDLAVLGPLDEYRFPDYCEAFWDYCGQAIGLDIHKEPLIVHKEMPLGIWSHEGFKIDCTGKRTNPTGFKLSVSGPIKSGTSGGPIVLANGNLVAIVSISGGALDATNTVGTQPIIWRILPEYIREQL